MKDDLRYTPSDCFDTFPLPSGFNTDPDLERIGRIYEERRGQIMQRYSKGLTATYNEFHTPDSDWPEITELRDLHQAMDRAVLDAYGWTDVQPRCDFHREFDEDENEEDESRVRRVKYRLRWPDDVRDDVLARLLELNRVRALEEGQLPTEPVMLVSTGKSQPQKANGKKRGSKSPGQDLNLSLLPHETEAP